MTGPSTSNRASQRTRTDLPRGSARGLALIASTFAIVLTACGSSGTTSPTAVATNPPGGATSAPTSAPTQAASAQCPSGGTVGSALGLTLPSPTNIPGGVPLPGGASGVACNYLAQSSDVLVELVVNISAAYVMRAEQAVSARSSQVHLVSLSGVGDQAVSYSYAIGSAGVAEGVLAIKGSTFVGVFATRTPATLTEVEALVTQLLG